MNNDNNNIMKISKSTGYALVSAGYIAQQYKEDPISASIVSKQYDISLCYLLKILEQLVRANILRSKRGPRGGFTLARPAKDITILEIIEAVDGSMLSHLQITEHTNNEPFSIKMEKVCLSAIEKARKLYSKATLAEMLK